MNDSPLVTLNMNMLEFKSMGGTNPGVKFELFLKFSLLCVFNVMNIHLQFM